MIGTYNGFAFRIETVSIKNDRQFEYLIAYDRHNNYTRLERVDSRDYKGVMHLRKVYQNMIESLTPCCLDRETVFAQAKRANGIDHPFPAGTPWAVVADWYEERGDNHRAEWMREPCYGNFIVTDMKIDSTNEKDYPSVKRYVEHGKVYDVYNFAVKYSDNKNHWNLETWGPHCIFNDDHKVIDYDTSRYTCWAS